MRGTAKLLKSLGDGLIGQLVIKDAAIRRGGRLLFEGVSLDLAAGEACALTGPNGSGKTSLLKAVAGLVRLEAGEIGFGGLDAVEARGGGLHLVSPIAGSTFLLDPDVPTSGLVPLVAKGAPGLVWESDTLKFRDQSGAPYAVATEGDAPVLAA